MGPWFTSLREPRDGSACCLVPYRPGGVFTHSIRRVSYAIAYVTHITNADCTLLQDNLVGRYRQVKRTNRGIGGQISALRVL